MNPGSDTEMRIIGRIWAVTKNPAEISLLKRYKYDQSRFESLMVLYETHLHNIPQGLWRLFTKVCGKGQKRFEGACDAINANPEHAKGYCAHEQKEVVYIEYLTRTTHTAYMPRNTMCAHVDGRTSWRRGGSLRRCS